MVDIGEMQKDLRGAKLDGWLFYDFRGRDPIAHRILDLPPGMRTRRWFYFVPAKGNPRKLVHKIEAGALASLPGDTLYYAGQKELRGNLKKAIGKAKKVAMQYSPKNAIPYVAMVDAGTVELVRSFGAEVVTSGDLVAQFEATWTPEQIASHFAAGQIIDRITEEAFKEIGQRVRSRGAHEFEIQQWLEEAFRREGLTNENEPPNVSVNANTGNPHYCCTAEHSAPIREGDFVLLDIWGKKTTPGAVYYDITWTGFVGQAPSTRLCDIFTIVRAARDLGVRTVQDALAGQRRICGWEVDQAVRDYIERSGYGRFFVHRTGHSIGEAVHGNGANMDNLETRDEREIVPDSCFSIEPGIYLPEFGVRSEVDVLVRGDRAEVTGRIQQEIVII